MRFAILSALLLGASTTLAHPADNRESCCCCDISRPAIMCRVKADCVCPMVMCPASAPTVWLDSIYTGTDIGIIEPTETATQVEDEEPIETEAPGLEDESYECCCCDPSQPAIMCANEASAEECICLAVVCPTEAPTIYATETTATPTSTATPDAEPCCCCNPGQGEKGEVVCRMPDESGKDEGCYCPAVVCPADAPTRMVSASEPTSTS